MDSTNYVTLTRQSGLLKELQVTANNLANSSTTGYRAEGVVFAEHIKKGFAEGGSVSMTDARVRFTDMLQGGISKTGGTYDMAIQGDGFFQVQTPDGVRLTRNGAFSSSAQNELVTFDGYPVLNTGGAPIFIPPNGTPIQISPDGTISNNEGPISQVGVVRVDNPTALVREDGVFFRFDGDLLPVDQVSISQGFIENSNVDPVRQIARMIEVQRAYELGQKFLDREDERVRGVVRALGSIR